DLEDTANLLNTSIFSGAYDDEDVGAETDLNNLETNMNVSPNTTTIIYKDHLKDQIIGDINSATQIRRMTKIFKEHAMKQGKTGYTQEKGIDYDEVFAPVARIEAIRFKIENAFFGLHQAPRAWYETLSTYLLENGYRRGTIDKTLFIKKDRGDILLVHVYVDDIIFGSIKKSSCVEFEQMMHKRFQISSIWELTFFLGFQVQQKEDGIFISQDKSMIGSLMYLTASRPDIMFAVCACARFQVTPKTSHLHAVKRIFRYLKGQPKLGLWYPRDSSFDLEAFFDSDYVGASLDRKSTTGAEYIAATNCYGQVLWIQNQMLDYGFNFMNTKIHIDNESTICIVKKPVFHSKTKHIEIRHHFIKDSYEKKLIQVIKIHTEHNVADLLTKDFNVSSSIHYALTVSPTIYASYIEQLWATSKSKTVNDVKQIHATVDGKTVGLGSGRGPSRQDTTLGGVNAQTRFKTASKKSHNPPLSEGNTSGSGEDSMEHPVDLMDFVPPTPYDLPLSGGHTPGSDKGRPNFNELINLCTQLSNRVLVLENSKTAQDLVNQKLKRRVKRLEKALRTRTPGMKLFKIGTSRRKGLDKENVSK
ncbi:putative ribonuclease H-like domain-containing protein, partial [Tanacetum coccineum]